MRGMSQVACSECGTAVPVQSLYDLNGKAYCASCVQSAAEAARRAGQPSNYVPLINKSICARCNAYIPSDAAATQIGNARFCATCGPQVKDWQYPQWLKLGLVGLLLLLVVALVHGRKYFHAGRELYVGERLVEQGRHAEGLPHLQEALRIAPASDKAALLAAKAALLIGDVGSAQKAFQGHNNGYFENADSPEFQEANALWKRATDALEKAEQAAKLENQEGKEVEAARLMHEAASLYPQMRNLQTAAQAYDAGVAFAKKDYDGFVAISAKLWKDEPVAGSAAGLASALACKYAVTGDTSIRQQSEEMLAKAQQLAQGNPEDQKDLAEYLPRIRYRLDSREIITKQEYDRRFRSAKTASQ